MSRVCGCSSMPLFRSSASGDRAFCLLRRMIDGRPLVSGDCLDATSNGMTIPLKSFFARRNRRLRIEHVLPPSDQSSSSFSASLSPSFRHHHILLLPSLFFTSPATNSVMTFVVKNSIASSPPSRRCYTTLRRRMPRERKIEGRVDGL